MEKEYKPFGEEWEQHLMKLPKKFIIDLYRKACITNQDSSRLESQVKPACEWIDVNEKLPPFIEGKEFSENVLATNGKDLFVMNRTFLRNEGTFWCNCYGNIAGDGELDDDYEKTIIKWMPLPKP